MVADIYLAKIYFTDLSDYKIRPVLIYQELGDDCICFQITSQNYKSIKLTNHNLINGKLKKDSFVVVPKNFTLHKSIFTKKLATVKNDKFKEIKDSFCKQLKC
jgi:hypothetical protein